MFRVRIKRISLLGISKVLLLLLIISINMREPYIHSREILFFLFIICSFPFGNYKKLSNVIILLSIWGISLIYNIMIPGSNAIHGTWFQGIVISAYLFLLVFSNRHFYTIIIKAYILSAIIVSSIIVILFILVSLNEAIKLQLIDYFDNLSDFTFITIPKYPRKIIGLSFYFVWHRTSPIIVPALGYLYIKRLQGYKSKKDLLSIILFSVALWMSGTRANMLCAVLLFFCYIIFRLFLTRHRLLACIILFSVLGSGILVVNKLINDKGSSSNSIKFKATESYYRTYQTDYIRTIFFGWGYGSTFYHTGRNKYVDVTELSHLETIRRYGIISFCLIMIFIWLKPLINKCKHEHSITKYYYVIVVLAYIFLACTNPYLLDSVGFGTLLFFDAFFEYDTLNRNDNLQRRTISSRAA